MGACEWEGLAEAAAVQEEGGREGRGVVEGVDGSGAALLRGVGEV